MRISVVVLLLITAAAIAANPNTDNRRIPLFFIPNLGQAPDGVSFMAKGSGLTAYFSSGEIAYRSGGGAVRMRFEGAATARFEGAGALSGQANFLSGSPDKWRTGIPIYGALKCLGLYPGIDMSYGIRRRNLKSEFTVSPGADPRQIRIRYISASPARIDPDGSLLVPSATGTLRELPPVAWQVKAGQRVPVESHFELHPDGTVGFALGGYDPSRPLVIDPVLSYSTFLGGSNADAANAIAVDSTGAAFVAGFTESFDLPSVSPEQIATGGGNDAFVAKLSAAGNALIYCTYLGGRGDDRAFSIAIDSTGSAYVTGSTQSVNFPVRNPYQATLKGGTNAFVAKLTPTGNSLAYSTYLGGNGSDAGNGIAVDASGNAYITGDTSSTNFPANAFQTTYRGAQDAFVVKLNAAGSALTYSTYLGGGNTDHGAAIAIDSTGTAYVTGSTYSTDFPTANARQPAIGGGQDAFIARLNAAGSALVFSTFLGGTGGSTGYTEAGQGITVDSFGNAYVAGVTPSTNFPILNPAQSTLNGSTDAFVTKMSPAGVLLYSSYLGGSGMDCANAIAVDSNGYAYVAGYTYSTDFPVVSTIQAAGGVGTTDAFVTKLAPAGNSLVFSSYLGGNDSDNATGVGIDSGGNIYVAGWTLSSSFPTLNAYQSQNAGNYGAFVAKYVFNPAPPVSVSVSPSSGTGTSQNFTFTAASGAGYGNIAYMQIVIGNSNSCFFDFIAPGTVLINDDGGGGWAASGALGSAGTIQNSQCSLNLAASSATGVSNALALTLAITFKSSLQGPQVTYMSVGDQAGLISSWQQLGTWTPATAQPPASISVSPSSGTGTSQNFTFTAASGAGYGNIAYMQIIIGNSNSCFFDFIAPGTVLINDDGGGGWAASGALGSAGTIQNSQCSLNLAASSATGVSNALALTLAITFKSSLQGPQVTYMSVGDQAGLISSWQQLGTWTPATAQPPASISVSPSSGTGTSQNFTFTAASGAGYGNIAYMQIIIGNSNSCFFDFIAPGTVLINDDGGGGWAASGALGSAGTIQNSQCSLNLAASSATGVSNALALTLAITFKSSLQGPQVTYMSVGDKAGLISSWQQLGMWNP